ncbi:hypothetical protein NDU88_008478 [Pleurodeles waltl]|uniref:Uncharacterized protein n=1 Tax=Pleurodeles waltl TaxID=8319 RepID=A0AAV7QRW4_PLEWA|nr:hypothetical protein NDU88_008478 [Pleurodeles waltl]
MRKRRSGAQRKPGSSWTAPRLASTSRGRRLRRLDRARCGRETPAAGSFRPAGPDARISQETAGEPSPPPP